MLDMEELLKLSMDEIELSILQKHIENDKVSRNESIKTRQEQINKIYEDHYQKMEKIQDDHDKIMEELKIKQDAFEKVFGIKIQNIRSRIPKRQLYFGKVKIE